MKEGMSNTEEWLKQVREFEGDLNEKGYKYLGWENGWGKTYPAEYAAHREKDFKKGTSRSFSQRGTHETCWCDNCKIWWNVDMGD